MLFTGSQPRAARTKVAGNKKQRTDTSEDEVRDEIDGVPVTRRKFPPQVKPKAAARPKSASDMPDQDFIAKRVQDCYVIERMEQIPSVRGNNPYFHNKFQEQIYNEVLLKKPKDNYVEQHHINMAHMKAHPEYFGEALAICEEIGLLPMMELEQDFDEKLVAQFLATVHMGNETKRRIVWMTKDQKFEVLWEEVAAMFEYEEFGPFEPDDFEETHFRVHFPGVEAKDVSELLPLYDPDSAVKWKVGKSKGLFPTWDIMHRIYRETINPKVGNIDEIHAYLKNLLLLTKDMQGKGKQLDVMDYIWNELWHVISKRKNIAFAPLIMRIIVWKWLENNSIEDLGDTEQWIPHKSKKLLIKSHPKKTSKEVVDEAGPSKVGPMKWMALQMKKIFKVSKKVERFQYDTYEEKMKARQAEVALRRAQGEDVQSGSEKNIKTWDEWQAQDSAGNVITWSDYEEDDATSQPPPAGFE